MSIDDEGAEDGDAWDGPSNYRGLGVADPIKAVEVPDERR